ncbi:hypothetical protein JL101_010420 [Skermanella rosea]|uniref:hypothetical protein n=1 Tax=Skermanella rosea TaxID=1817965 RepID=UPI0019318A52|nr:hypothetical protein [Skermanella rosea]UEM05819.1 hypothetical protein JL101_010420 [Skermanella rosea]
MIKIEITLSTAKLNADRHRDDQLDPLDYAQKLAVHLQPRLDHVVVKTTAFGRDHNIDIVLPEKAANHLDMTDILARRIAEAVRAFHATAPDHVLRLPKRRFFSVG